MLQFQKNAQKLTHHIPNPMHLTSRHDQPERQGRKRIIYYNLSRGRQCTLELESSMVHDAVSSFLIIGTDRSGKSIWKRVVLATLESTKNLAESIRQSSLDKKVSPPILPD